MLSISLMLHVGVLILTRSSRIEMFFSEIESGVFYVIGGRLVVGVE